MPPPTGAKVNPALTVHLEVSVRIHLVVGEELATDMYSIHYHIT